MTINKKRILVTGHNGFVGRNLVKELKNLDAQVLILNDKYGRVDLRQWERIKNSFKTEEVNFIYHLAAETYVPISYENPRKVYDVNLLGTLNILELARLVNAEKIIYISSYVYGKPQYLPIDEEHPTKPNNPYSRSKLLAEQLIKSYYQDFGLRFVIFRPFNIYGRGQSPNFLIPSIIKQLEHGRIILKDYKPRRDFIHVQDVVKALIKGAKLKKDFDTFNLGYGKSYSVKEIVDKIIHIHGKQVPVKYVNERRKNEIMDTVADIRKAKNELGWAPQIDIEKGLADVVERYKSL